MDIYGVIAEYNPFHNGHLYQLNEIKKLSKRSFVIVIMSGYFCQRGEPAIISPQTRTKIALEHGADLVLQIPTYASLGSAELFASTATRLLAATGICSHIVFGSEKDQLNNLDKIASLLIKKPEDMWKFIEEELKEGLSYAKARENFVAKQLNTNLASLLQESNQILAIEYLKAIKQYDLKLEPLLIPRIGDSSYLNEDLTASQTYTSAKAIRNKTLALADEINFPYNLIDQLSSYVPIKALAKLSYDLSKDAFLSMEKMSDLYYLALEVSQLPKTRYMNKAIFNRLKREVRFSSDKYLAIDQLAENVKTKQYPKTRINRALTNLLLNIREQTNFKPSYLHVLGFNRDGRYLLKRMRSSATLPIVNNFSDIAKSLNKDEQWQENLELRAARIWLNCAKQALDQVFDSPILIR